MRTAYACTLQCNVTLTKSHSSIFDNLKIFIDYIYILTINLFCWFSSLPSQEKRIINFGTYFSIILYKLKYFNCVRWGSFRIKLISGHLWIAWILRILEMVACTKITTKSSFNHLCFDGQLFNFYWLKRQYWHCLFKSNSCQIFLTFLETNNLVIQSRLLFWDQRIEDNKNTKKLSVW